MRFPEYEVKVDRRGGILLETQVRYKTFKMHFLIVQLSKCFVPLLYTTSGHNASSIKSIELKNGFFNIKYSESNLTH